MREKKNTSAISAKLDTCRLRLAIDAISAGSAVLVVRASPDALKRRMKALESSGEDDAADASGALLGRKSLSV